jgi:putative hydrolase of the HAD superfamily
MSEAGADSHIRAVIFDVGGVLVRTFDRGPRAAWEERLGLGPGGADELVFHSAMGQAAQRGEVTNDALWSWIEQQVDLGDAFADFRRDFWVGDRLDETLVALIRSLRPRYQTAIISNATDALLRSLTTDHPIAADFDLIVGSAAEGIMKPDPRIYRNTLQRLGRKPDQAVFIDDAPANVAAAQALGMQAIRFTQNTDLAAELRALGLVF